MSAIINWISVGEQVSQTSTLSSESRSGMSRCPTSCAQHARRSGGTADKRRRTSATCPSHVSSVLLLVVLGTQHSFIFEELL